MTPVRVRTKLCGITSVHDAEMCVDLGADSLGLNFVSGTKRCISEDTARAIIAAVGARTLVVGVVANMAVNDLTRLKAELGLHCLQLHGDETPDFLQYFLPHAYKAVAVKTPDDLTRARSFGGGYILLDAPPDLGGRTGGTGVSWSYELAAPLALERRVSLAGGLHAGNVAAAIHAVRPWCVDVASGIEIDGARAGEKCQARVVAFIDAVTRASAELGSAPPAR